MKKRKLIASALIRAGPDPYSMRFTGGHEMGGKAQEDALRAPSKDLGQG